jgi:hypothetical protein
VRQRFSRLSLLTKILLSTTVAITILFAITGEIVLHNITRTMSDSLRQEVQDSFRAYTSLCAPRSVRAIAPPSRTPWVNCGAKSSTRTPFFW